MTAAAKKMEKAPVLAMEARVLRQLLSVALLWASDDDTRPHLTCVRFESSAQRVSAIATNGHGLWVCESMPVAQPVGAFEQSVQASDLRTILRHLSAKDRSEATLRLGAEPAFKLGRLTLELARDEEQFPNWRRVVAEQPDPKKPAANRVGMATRYMARIAKSLPGNSSRSDVVMSIGSTELDAVRFSGFVGETPAYVLLMPTRI